MDLLDGHQSRVSGKASILKSLCSRIGCLSAWAPDRQHHFRYRRVIICAVIFYYGVELVVAQGNVPYAGIKISTSWGYLAVVLGCGLMILRTLVSIKRSALTLINGKLPADTKAREGGD